MKGGAYSVAFAGRLRRLEPSLPEEVVSVAMFLAHITLTQKNVCLDVGKVRRRSEVAEVEGDEGLPSVEELQAWAEKFPKVFGVPGRDGAPLVVEGSRLYLQRYYRAECRLAANLVKLSEGRATASRQAVSCVAETPNIQHPTSNIELDSSQREAVARVLANRLSVVTGGPGTGKTTLVCAVLSKVAATSSSPSLKIIACAPTGKAQARLKEAIEKGVQESRSSGVQNVEYATIHRLLGYNPMKMAYKYSADNPIEADVVVVDEASMADVLLMDKLMEAIPGDARVILLGDKRQLAAVENGSVLRDICDAWEGRPNVAVLSTSHRFGAESSLGRIQAAFHTEDAERIREALRRPDEGFEWREMSSDGGRDAAATLCSEFAAYREAKTAEEGFARFNTFRILCATRKGRHGTEAMNRWMMSYLGMRPYQHGYPVMVTVNDYEHQLFNGDIGLCWEGKDGAVRVHFEDGRAIGVSQLPEHEPVFAMTVHKAQGSGFDTVLVTLPETSMPLLTRELLYTAITRAKRRCILWGGEPQVRHCAEHETLRMSGLAERL